MPPVCFFHSNLDIIDHRSDSLLFLLDGFSDDPDREPDVKQLGHCHDNCIWYESTILYRLLCFLDRGQHFF